MNYKKQIIQECRVLFQDKTCNFKKKLDSNLNLLGFNNGVFCLDINSFKNTCSQDYLTLTTQYNYIEYSLDNHILLQIKDILDEILDHDYLVFMIKTLRSFLNGHQKHNSYLFLIGDRNSRKILIQLLVESLGEYLQKLPQDLINCDSSFIALNPELALTRGKRIGVIEVMENSENISLAKINELANREMIIARKYYNQPFEFKPQLDLIISSDIAIDKKNCVVFKPFLSEKFDNTINLDQYKSAFIWMLLNHEI